MASRLVLMPVLPISTVSLALNFDVAAGMLTAKELRVSKADPTPQAVRMIKSRRFITLLPVAMICL
jgi:hypothetical protein